MLKRLLKKRLKVICLYMHSKSYSKSQPWPSCVLSLLWIVRMGIYICACAYACCSFAVTCQSVFDSKNKELSGIIFSQESLHEIYRKRLISESEPLLCTKQVYMVTRNRVANVYNIENWPRLSLRVMHML